MDRRWAIGCMSGMLASLLLAGSAFTAHATQQADSSKGLTVEELTRGVRSAAKNIEQEIPKVGPAVGKTLKSIGGHSSEQKPSQHPPSSKR